MSANEPVDVVTRAEAFIRQDDVHEPMHDRFLWVIGYDKASAIAHRANDEGLTLKEAALKSGYIDEKRFDEIVDPRKMVGHGVAGS
jgi:fumarate hydratase class II